MPRTIIDRNGDEISEADFDDYVLPAYRRLLARHPHCADPDHPGCKHCYADWDDTEDHSEDFVETENFNDEPVPYDGHKEA